MMNITTGTFQHNGGEKKYRIGISPTFTDFAYIEFSLRWGTKTYWCDLIFTYKF